MGQQAIHKFVLGAKEVEGISAEFQYDRGTYSIVQINGEERETIYKSRNAQEAYMKWNVYIGRKKERPVREHEQTDGETRSRRNRTRQESDTRRNNRRSTERRDGADNHRSTDNRRNTEKREGTDNRRSTEKRENIDNRRNIEKREGANHRSDSRGENNTAKNHTNYKKKSDTHSQLEKRKAKAKKDWVRRRREEEYSDEV